MRCQNCPYRHKPYYEGDEYLCEIFGYCDDEMTENSKGECGCKYNMITLKKMYEEQKKIENESILKDMEGFVEFMDE